MTSRAPTERAYPLARELLMPSGAVAAGHLTAGTIDIRHDWQITKRKHP